MSVITPACPNCHHPLIIPVDEPKLTQNETIVWQALKATHPMFVSTRTLNAKLGYTDPGYHGVKVFVRRLRSKGYLIESNHTRGYRAVLPTDFAEAAP